MIIGLIFIIFIPFPIDKSRRSRIWRTGVCLCLRFRVIRDVNKNYFRVCYQSWNDYFSTVSRDFRRQHACLTLERCAWLTICHSQYFYLTSCFIDEIRNAGDLPSRYNCAFASAKMSTYARFRILGKISWAIP